MTSSQRKILTLALVALAAISDARLAFSSVEPFTSEPLYMAASSSLAFAPLQPRLPLTENRTEKYDSGFAFYVDNDLLTPDRNDRDYTGGLAVTLSGKRAKDYWFSLDSGLSALEYIAGLGDLSKKRSHHQLHSIELGATAFTPDDVEDENAIHSDRPYASLFYLSNTRHHIDKVNKSAITTVLTVGVIGAPIAGEVYNGIHRAIGNEEGEGWSHQISDGGELTARFGISKQTVIASDYSNRSQSFEIKSLLQGSVGYLTEVSYGITGRWGRINTPWWTFNPANAKYTEKASAVTPFKRTNDLFVFGGFSSHLRGYNAFLEGQWKSSEVAFQRNELETIIHEAWVGVTWGVDEHTNISYFIRGQTSEIKHGDGDRNPVWGGFVVNYSI